MMCWVFCGVLILLLTSYCNSKLRVSEIEWNEMKKFRKIDKILEHADLVESIIEDSDWCQWIKVNGKYFVQIQIFFHFVVFKEQV